MYTIYKEARLAKVLLLVFLLVVLGACSGAAPAEPAAEKDLRIAVNEHPATFDPIQSTNTTVNRFNVLAYEALLDYRADEGLAPWVAKDWEISGDGLTYTFNLNEGITFHDGSDLTASDVKFTFDRILAMNESIASALGNVESVDVIDDLTVVVNLSQPEAPFIQTMPKIFIINEDGVEANQVDGDWAAAYLVDNDLGSGPYTVTSFTPEQQVILDRYDDYWQGWEGRDVSKIIYTFVKESATQRLLLENGEIDIAMNPATGDLAALTADPTIDVEEGTTLVEFYVQLRTIREPLDNPLVRQALALAYDYDTHMQVVLEGYGERAKGPLPNEMLYHEGGLPVQEQNLEEARRLLAEAGYPGGGFTLKAAYLPVLDEWAKSVEIMQQSFGEIGIEVESEGFTWPQFSGHFQDPESDFDLYTIYIFPNSADPDDALRRVYHSENTGAAGCCNAAWYVNDEVDRLMDQGKVSTDPAERESLYKEIQQMIFDDQPSIFVSNPPWIIAVRDYVDNYLYNSTYHQTVRAYDIGLEGKSE